MSTHRRIAALLALLFIASGAAALPRRPNILLLMAEDMSSRVRAYGDFAAVTPNLDALAEQGVSYTRTFATAGVCAPSRAALILGMHQIATGTQHMRTSSRPGGAYYAVPPVGVKAFPELLQKVGYFTYTDNKLDYQFSRVRAHTGPSTIWTHEGGRADDWSRRAPGQPFFGWINFQVTHESGVFAPLGTLPHSAMHFAIQLFRWWTLDPPVPEVVLPEDVLVPPYYPDIDVVRADMARHYNNITYMDAQVGEVLRQLDAAGLADSTIVIWTTDHGDPLPRAKRDLFDSGIRVPMIIRWPAAYRPAGVEPGSVDRRLISFVDLAPTILSLAGVPVPRNMHGRSFARVDAQPNQYIYASRDRIDELMDRQRAVRDERYKYLRSWYPWQPDGTDLDFRDNIDMVRVMREWHDTGGLDYVQMRWYMAPGKERLFDLEKDPYETRDISTSPRYRKVLLRMRRAMDTWLQEIGDTSEEDEDAMVARLVPDGKRKVTPAPEFILKDGVLEVAAVWGHSVKYRVNDGPWRIYSYPLAMRNIKKIEAMAVRYGWEESEIVSFP